MHSFQKRPTALFGLGLLLACFLAPGCTGSPPTQPICEQLAFSQTLELGTGSSAFEPLFEGDTLSQDFGPQGGDHVWGALQYEGIYEGGRWREEDNCQVQSCGPIPGAHSPRIHLQLWHGDLLVAGFDEPQLFEARVGEATGIYAPLRYPYSTAGFAGQEHEEIEEEAFVAAEEVEASLLLFTATVWDACGTELHDERQVRVQMPWLREIPEQTRN